MLRLSRTAESTDEVVVEMQPIRFLPSGPRATAVEIARVTLPRVARPVPIPGE